MSHALLSALHFLDDGDVFVPAPIGSMFLHDKQVHYNQYKHDYNRCQGVAVITACIISRYCSQESAFVVSIAHRHANTTARLRR